MPDLGEYAHFRDVDTQLLQRSGPQGWAQCVCGSGIQSEHTGRCYNCYFPITHDVKPVEIPASFSGDLWNLVDFCQPPVLSRTIAMAEVDSVSSLYEQPFKVETVPNSDSPLGVTSSPYIKPLPQRGRPPNGSKTGSQRYKGVRQRKGVSGYLVEIRPSKWKKTIWLGTYNTDTEAAAAYDAGVFYTNKKTKFNFPELNGTFPSLPSKLRLDVPGHSEEIKMFVQREAKAAARKVMSLLSKSNQEPTAAVAAPAVASSSSTSSSSVESLVELDAALAMPPLDFYLSLEDGLFWGQCPSSYIISDFNMSI